MKLIFSDKAYLAVLAETSEKIATETGGIFLGCFEDETFYVVEAIDPGPRSIFQVTYFEYDQKYTQHLINKVARLYNHELTLVGLWHRHPGSFDCFSSTDNGTNLKYAQMSDYGAISVLINIDPNFRMTAYHVTNPLQYRHISYEIGDSLIPEHIKIPKSVTELQNQINGFEERKKGSAKSKTSLKKLMDIIKPHFVDEFNMNEDETDGEVAHAEMEILNYLTESILDDISYLSEEKGIALTIEQDKEKNKIVLSQKDGTAKISFGYLSASKQVLFSYDGEVFLYREGLFAELLEDSPVENEGESRRASFKKEVLKTLGINKQEE